MHRDIDTDLICDKINKNRLSHESAKGLDELNFICDLHRTSIYESAFVVSNATRSQHLNDKSHFVDHCCRWKGARHDDMERKRKISD